MMGPGLRRDDRQNFTRVSNHETAIVADEWLSQN